LAIEGVPNELASGKGISRIGQSNLKTKTIAKAMGFVLDDRDQINTHV
jgi:hypothetical protein